MKLDIVELKDICPMPILMERIGLGEYAKSICRSPFRKDTKSSFGIFQASSGDWLFKDHATGESGDEIHLLAKHFGINPENEFPELMEKYNTISGCVPTKGAPPSVVSESRIPIRTDLDLSGYHTGSKSEIRSLSVSRPYYREGLNWASERGVLLFGTVQGASVYLVTDKASKLAEARRIDGKAFARRNKSHCLKGSSKSWPVGILEAQQYPNIALVEGVPDFLHAHYGILYEQAPHHSSTDVQCAPVAMLGASCTIACDALEYFKDKNVTLFPHVDPAGKEAAQRWGDQIYNAGAKEIGVFDLDGAINEQGKKVNDLYDTYCLSRESIKSNPSLERMFHA